jgi:hypothetical protein
MGTIAAALDTGDLVGQNANLGREMPVAEPEMPPQGIMQ